MAKDKIDRIPVVEKAIEQIKSKLATMNSSEKKSGSILNEEAENWIRKKLSKESMGTWEWIKGRRYVYKIDKALSKSDVKFFIGDWFDSITDFVKSTRIDIQKAKTKTELETLMLKIETEIPHVDENDNNSEDNVSNIETTDTGKNILYTVNQAIKNKITGKHCGDWVKKIFEASGFIYGNTKQVVRAYQGKPYAKSPESKDPKLEAKTDYQKDETSYLKLLNSVQKGDHLIFHNNNKYDEYGNHSGIFVERDQSKGGKPFAKIASLPGSGKQANIKTYNIGRGEITKHKIPKGQICAIRRCNGSSVGKDKIASNLGKYPVANA